MEIISNKIIKLYNKIFQFISKQTFEDSLLKKYSYCKQLKKYNVKILFITDTHDCLTYEKDTLEFIKRIKDYDACILLGDHSAKDLEEILKIVPNNKIYGVLGNHDSWDKYEVHNINNINGKVVHIKGMQIAGIGGSYKYKTTNQYSMYSHEESITIADSMEEADILISHDKPFTTKQYGDAHDGLKGITKYIYKNHIPIHIHGHLHQENEEILKNGTTSICLYKVKCIEL